MNKEKFLNLPKVTWDDFKIEYDVDFWNGPTSGMGNLNGERLWFDMLDEDFEANPDIEGFSIRTRTFVLYRPTARQQEEQDYWHSEFVKHVRNGDHVRPQIEHDKFYVPYEDKKDLLEPFTESQAVYVLIERN